MAWAHPLSSLLAHTLRYCLPLPDSPLSPSNIPSPPTTSLCTRLLCPEIPSLSFLPLFSLGHLQYLVPSPGQSLLVVLLSLQTRSLVPSRAFLSPCTFPRGPRRPCHYLLTCGLINVGHSHFSYTTGPWAQPQFIPRPGRGWVWVRAYCTNEWVLSYLDQAQAGASLSQFSPSIIVLPLSLSLSISPTPSTPLSPTLLPSTALSLLPLCFSDFLSPFWSPDSFAKISQPKTFAATAPPRVHLWDGPTLEQLTAVQPNPAQLSPLFWHISTSSALVFLALRPHHLCNPLSV